MGVLEEIRERIEQRHPELRYTLDASSIHVSAPTEEGFDVSLFDNGGEFVVYYGEGWHEHFTSKEEALNCFAFGFSNQCRLKIVRRGSFAYQWTVESLQDGKWIEDSTTGTLPLMFWRPRTVEYRQNKLT